MNRYQLPAHERLKCEAQSVAERIWPEAGCVSVVVLPSITGDGWRWFAWVDLDTGRDRWGDELPECVSEVDALSQLVKALEALRDDVAQELRERDDEERYAAIVDRDIDEAAAE